MCWQTSWPLMLAQPRKRGCSCLWRAWRVPPWRTCSGARSGVMQASGTTAQPAAMQLRWKLLKASWHRPAGLELQRTKHKSAASKQKAADASGSADAFLPDSDAM